MDAGLTMAWARTIAGLADPPRRAELGASASHPPDGASAPVELISILRCPSCATEHPEQMPVDACRFFHECRACGTLLRPRPGDCCVFCSYGSVPCPPVQTGRGCCDGLRGPG